MTNTVTYLPQVDQIVVLQDGEILEIGSYQELFSHNGHFAEFITTYLNDAGEDKEQLTTTGGQRYNIIHYIQLSASQQCMESKFRPTINPFALNTR